MAYEFTDRVFLGTIPGLTRGIHPLNDPPGPGNNAGVRENKYQVDRAGEYEVWRGHRIECVGEFASDADSCTAVCYHSRVNPASTDYSPETDGADRWVARAAETPIKDRDAADAAGGNVVRFILAGAQWFTIRVIDGTPPTQWRVYAIPDREGGVLAIG